MVENTPILDNTLELKSIYSIKNEMFIIPSFQRGYRWETVQVTALLNDIKEYIDNKDKMNTFMCLQPVVFYNKDDKLVVIDGQQRLTTIAIINKCLEINSINIEYDKYEINKALQEILDDIKQFINEDAAILLYGLFENNNKLLYENTNKIYKEYCDKFNTLDEYYMILAYLTIKCWLKKNTDIEEKIKSLLKSDEDNYSIKFIWYDVTKEISNNEKKAIDIFTRLNIGKIPLTEAELIKALFLKKDNFKESEIEKKFHIAYKWDEIEKTLNNDSFWYFLSNDKNKSKQDRIELILELASDVENGKNHELFLNYENILKTDFDERWHQIEESFMTLKEWYHDKKMYHYVGLLVYSEIPLKDIYKNRAAINKYIIDNIKNIFNIKIDNTINDNINNIKEYLKKLNFGKSTDKHYLRRILLFADIYTIINFNSTNSNNEKSETFMYRFPFDLFIKEKWDIEHISPQTVNKLKSNEEQKEWFKDTYTYLYDKWNKDELLTMYPYICDKNDLEKLENENSELYKKIIFDEQFKNILELNIFNLDGYENGIGNLVLLNSDINRSYGNKLYGIKKSEIIEYDKKGRFIPIITKNAFFKYYSKNNDANFWTKYDAEDLCEEICILIDKFIKNLIIKVDKQK